MLISIKFVLSKVIITQHNIVKNSYQYCKQNVLKVASINKSYNKLYLCVLSTYRSMKPKMNAAKTNWIDNMNTTSANDRIMKSLLDYRRHACLLDKAIMQKY